MFYGYSETLDATLLYWFDLTRINPFIEVTRYGPAGTAGHRGRSFGHTLTTSDLRKLPIGESVVLYDAYLYLTPGRPADEDAMFEDFLLQVSDIYDLIAKPEISSPDWQALARETLADLDDPETWVELEREALLARLRFRYASERRGDHATRRRARRSAIRGPLRRRAGDPDCRAGRGNAGGLLQPGVWTRPEQWPHRNYRPPGAGRHLV